ncbi:MAG TPA: nitroreductase family protein [Acidimicrobiia bacterium]|nr:nitroreductase family protein [Acidimicrobiia bacterium]
MELGDALRTTGAIRDFRDDPVPPEVVHRILDAARFAPSGGNRQGWRVIVVTDTSTRSRLRDLYLSGWYEYLAQVEAGLVPWAPITDEAAEARAIANGPAVAARAASAPGGFAEQFDSVPVLLTVLADLRRLAAVDRDLHRYTLVGAASIYPFAWNVLLAARDEGLGGVITTMPIRREPDLKDLLGIPDEFAVAAVIALGYPTRQFRRLTRAAVGEFTTLDHFDGPAFEG